MDVQGLLRSDVTADSHSFLYKEGGKAHWDIQITVKGKYLKKTEK